MTRLTATLAATALPLLPGLSGLPAHPVTAGAAPAAHTSTTGAAPAALPEARPASLPASRAAAPSPVALRLEAPRTFTMYSADEGAEGETAEFVVPVSVVRSAGGPARRVRVIVDTSGLAGVARVTEGGYGNCTAAGPVFTCVYGDVQNGDGEANAPFALHGLAGVEPGDAGTVTYTATADNAALVTGTTRMLVGEPRLRAPRGERTVGGLRPGRAAEFTPALANTTRFPARRGVALRVHADGLRLAPRHSNCFYVARDAVAEASTGTPDSAWCVFPDRPPPGTAYRTAVPLAYSAPDGAMRGALTYSWSAAPERPEGHPVRGTGAPLTLVRAASDAKDSTDATDSKGAAALGAFTADEGRLAVTTTTQADYRPVTAPVRGRVGDTVAVRLGVRDLGPGTPPDSDSLGRFEVVPPEGTTVTSVPWTFEGDGGDWACDRPERPGPGAAFVCDLGNDRLMEARHEEHAPETEGGTGTTGNPVTETTIVFHVRIDRRVPGAHGTVRVGNPFDRTPGNDVAVFPLEASPAPPLYRRPGTWLAVGAAGAALAGAAFAVRVRLRRRRPEPPRPRPNP
ncbi:hypothetical protein ACFWNK_06370 [Streptomyces sp. NPDC058417]|uniref:hypothetical protein n=1 Tax=unclassified Streptomyces TaxID=2593676 RepID=UPI00365E100B